MKQDNIYISIIAIIFTALVCVFDFLPRSTFSILEKRDLKQFPKYRSKVCEQAISQRILTLGLVIVNLTEISL